jgi:hypothetical protein
MLRVGYIKAVAVLGLRQLPFYLKHSMCTVQARSGSNSTPFEENCKFILAAGEHACNNARASTLSTEPDTCPKVLPETWGHTKDQIVFFASPGRCGTVVRLRDYFAL